MFRRSICLPVVLLFLVVDVNLCEGNRKILLTDISTLTLHRDKYTTGRRSTPIPQIQCVGGSAKGRFEPRVVQCYNRGYDGLDVQWECKADMSDEYEFGEIRISCEGYDSAEDPYVLQGSCGLKYNLEYAHGKKVPSAPPYEKDGKFEFSSLSFIAFGLLFFYIVYTSCFPSSRGDDVRRGDWNWDQGPPPPPSSGRPSPPGFKSFSRPFDAPPTYDESCNAFATHSQSSGPGFFSGLGLGGLAGYMYGRSQNREDSFFHNRRPYERNYSFGGSSSSEYRNHSPEPSTSRTVSGFGGTERR